MKDEDIVVISRHMSFSKVIRYSLDRLSKSEKIMLSAAVENADLFEDIKQHLVNTFRCKAQIVETGHFKQGGRHIPIIRCVIKANNLEFDKEFSPMK